MPEAEIESESSSIERNLGAQPLEALMMEHGLSNHDVVAACKEPLTHKAVGRARKGRRLTPSMQKRVTEAFNEAMIRKGEATEQPWRVSDLFTY